jgi:hypothetical protein
VSTDGAQPGAAEPAPPPLIPIRNEGYFGGVELLAADARVASLFAGEARRRTMHRLFGISKADKSGLATLIALLALGEAMQRRTSGYSKPKPPTTVGALVGLGLVKELAYDIAGPWSRESTYFGTLLTFALIGASARFAVRGTVRSARSVSHKGIAEFEHRYGHMIRPNRNGARP